MPKKEKIYTIIDIETTGGMPNRDRITEIAMVKIINGEITDRFESLVNPERSIPAEITRITGITNTMVEHAPRFYEIAKTIVEFTEDAVFVAHNVRFDYNFIREEFKSLGYTYSKKVLCTVKLSRKVFPGLRSYSLGNLIQHFGISVANRHRAMDDVLATADIFLRIVKGDQHEDHISDMVDGGIKEFNLPGNITMDFLHGLPEEPGVYYFYNVHGTVIYVGKSINIKSRIFQHFGTIDSKTERLSKQSHAVSFELTGNELIAMLLESAEIKKLHPEINKAQRTREYPYFIHSFYDEKGYLCFGYDRTGKKNEKDKDILSYVATKQGAKGTVYQAVKMFSLCPGKCGLNDCGSDCFYHRSMECAGAALTLESPADYNERAAEGREMLLKIFREDFFLLLDGRSPDEKALVLVQDGHYRGYGYLMKDSLDLGTEEWLEAIDYVRPTPEFDRIVSQFMQRNKHFKKVVL